jgi:hypothetical protein
LYKYLYRVLKSPRAPRWCGPAGKACMSAELGLSEKVEVVCLQREYAWQSGVFAQGLTPRRTCTWEQDGKAGRSKEWLNTIGPITGGKTMPLPTYCLGGNPAFQKVSPTQIACACD